MSVDFNRIDEAEIKLQDFSAYFWNTPRMRLYMSKCQHADLPLIQGLSYTRIYTEQKKKVNTYFIQ